MGMNALTLATLIAFWAKYPDSEMELRDWYKLVRQHEFSNFAEVKAIFPSADWVKGFIVFDILGNEYRLIIRPNFAGKRFKIVFVGTHKRYDAWTQDMRSK